MFFLLTLNMLQNMFLEAKKFERYQVWKSDSVLLSPWPSILSLIITQ
jgi:hypothetical protein